MALYGSMWAVAVFGFRWLSTLGDRAEERRSRAMTEQILTAGTLPPGADPHEWRGRLEQERRVAAEARWGVLVVALLLAALVGEASVVANDNSPAVWTVAGLLVLLGIAGYRWQARRLARARWLLDRLPT